jgi:hypothetical protein
MLGWREAGKVRHLRSGDNLEPPPLPQLLLGFVNSAGVAALIIEIDSFRLKSELFISEG